MKNEFTVVTTFHKAGYNEYGYKMLKTFNKYWPKTVNMFAYYEDELPNVSKKRIELFDFTKTCPGWTSFYERHKDNPVAMGTASKYPGSGKRYRYEAVRFSHKIFAIYQAHLLNKSRYLIWLDADVVTVKPIPISWLRSITHPEAYISALLREKYHDYTECGFMIFDTHNPYNNEFMERYHDMYDKDGFLNEYEWHDSWLFDVVRRQMQNEGKIRSLDLAPKTRCGHPFVQGILGLYFDHLRGRRKAIGKSPERVIR